MGQSLSSVFEQTMHDEFVEMTKDTAGFVMYRDAMWKCTRMAMYYASMCWVHWDFEKKEIVVHPAPGLDWDYMTGIIPRSYDENYKLPEALEIRKRVSKSLALLVNDAYFYGGGGDKSLMRATFCRNIARLAAVDVVHKFLDDARSGKLPGNIELPRELKLQGEFLLAVLKKDYR